MTKLRRYQRVGVRRIHFKFKGVTLLADDMGLGKTLQVLTYIRRYLDKGPILVVCPASAKYVWESQAAEHIGMQSILLSSRTPDPKVIRMMRTGMKRLFVINYEVLHFWKDALKGANIQLIVADECQRAKSWAAKCTKALIELAKATPKKIFVGGTGGVEKTPKDLWPVIHCFVKKSWPKSWKRMAYDKTQSQFVQTFCKVRRTPWGLQIIGPKNLKRLNKFAKRHFMVRRRTIDVLKDLPPKQRHIVEMPIKNRRKYFKLENKSADWAEHYRGDQRQRRIKELAKVGRLMRMASRLKKDYVIEWINQFLEETNEKLLCFGVHKFIVRDLQKHFGDKIATRVDGSVKGEKRKAAFHRFNTDKKCRLMFGNIKAAGEAWSCKSASSTVFIEMWPNPAVHNQAEKRTHGLGRGVKGRISRMFYLVAKDTIEERLVKKLHKEQQIIDGILDGGEGGEGFDMTKLIRSILVPKKRMKR